jgi:hypothetical protein
MSLTAVVTGQRLLAVASGDRKFRDRHVSHAAARLNAKPMSVARATVAADVRHHKPLTMHEFNSSSGGCVSRSLATAKPMSVALATVFAASFVIRHSSFNVRRTFCSFPEHHQWNT